MAASGRGDRLPVGDDAEADGVGVQLVGGEPPSDHQPGRFGWGGAMGAVQDPDDGVLGEAGGEERPEGDADG